MHLFVELIHTCLEYSVYSSSKEQSESCLKTQIEFIRGEERMYTPFM